MPKRKTFEEVSEIFKGQGLTLLPQTYVNNKQKLEFICPEHGGTQFMRLNDLITGHGCPTCGNAKKRIRAMALAESQKLTHDYVKDYFEKRGMQLASQYKNGRTRLIYFCPNHPCDILRVRFNDFKASEYGCRFCAIDAGKVGIDHAREAFSSLGFELLEEEYVNSQTRMRFICEKHPEEEQKTTYGSVKVGKGCYWCGIEKISGVNHYKYNPNVPEHVRQTERIYDEQARKWRTEVFKRDKFTCKVCEETAGTLNAHHLDGYNWAIESRYNLDNGITLCITCHRSFHSKYGFGNNTKEQFHEWIGGKR